MKAVLLCFHNEGKGVSCYVNESSDEAQSLFKHNCVVYRCSYLHWSGIIIDIIKNSEN